MTSPVSRRFLLDTGGFSEGSSFTLLDENPHEARQTPVPCKIVGHAPDAVGDWQPEQMLNPQLCVINAGPHGQQPSEWFVVMHWNGLIRKSLTQYGMPSVDLEDETDKAVQIIVAEWHKYQKSRGDVDSWIKGICFNVYRNYRKQARVRRHSNADVTELNIASEYHNPQEIVAALEARDIILSILDLMNDEVLARIWWLWNFDECPARVIGDAHGVTEKQARRLIEKADGSFAKAKIHYELAMTKARLEKTHARKGGK